MSILYFGFKFWGGWDLLAKGTSRSYWSGWFMLPSVLLRSLFWPHKIDSLYWIQNFTKTMSFHSTIVATTQFIIYWTEFSSCIWSQIVEVVVLEIKKVFDVVYVVYVCWIWHIDFACAQFCGIVWLTSNMKAMLISCCGTPNNQYGIVNV